MSGYVRATKFEVDFEGEKVSGTLTPLSVIDLLHLQSLGADNKQELASVHADLLPKYVKDFVGPKAADDSAVAIEALGGDSSAFETFRNLEDRIDGVDDVFQAQREVDDMLTTQGSPSGMSRAEVEARFRELEGGAGAGDGGGDGLDAELAELKQKVRVKLE
jgi:hypothetical protein